MQREAKRFPSLLSCGMKQLDLSKPCVMGILNVSPNSFAQVGRMRAPQEALDYAKQMEMDGAAIIDIGAEATNPATEPTLSLQQELDRLLPILEVVIPVLDVPVSIDTSKPEVMQAAVKLGAHMINDVRALREPGALAQVAKRNVAVCLMHMAYPQGMAEIVSSPNQRVSRFTGPCHGRCLFASQAHFDQARSHTTPPGDSPSDLEKMQDIVFEVKDFLQERIAACLAAGIRKDQIIIDPGIGHGNFGKDLNQNLSLLRHLASFTDLGQPILIGVSRKTFIGELLECPPQQRLYGSIAAAIMAVHQGASIVRAHDVKATVEAITVCTAIKEEMQ